MEIPSRVYRPRDPRKTSLFRLVDSLYDRVKGVWEERFERAYGFWRGLVDEVVERYLDCGVSGKWFRKGSLPQVPRGVLGCVLL